MLQQAAIAPAHRIPAAYIYLGQFLAHDMSVMDWSETAQVNGATGAWINANHLHELSFDSLFGTVNPAGVATSLWIDESGATVVRATPPPLGLEPTFDLPRAGADGAHCCKDARVDSNLGLAQMHVLLARFHQEMAKALNLTEDQAIAETRRHLQAVVLTDYLRKIIPDAIYDQVMLDGRTVVNAAPSDFLVPIEFAAAVFRFGHSMVGNTYPLWTIPWPAGSFMQSQSADLTSLIAYTQAGGSLPFDQVEFHWAQPWRHMTEAQRDYLMVNRVFARPISASISGKFGALSRNSFPDPQDSTNTAPFNLARMTLGRGKGFGLPSGQQMADLAGAAQLDVKQFLTDRPGRFAGLTNDNALCNETPLWFYTLAEAEALGNGRLGPAAARIVMETFLAALLKSGTGFVTTAASGQTSINFERKVRLGQGDPHQFSLTDVVGVAYGGVD